MQEKDNTEELFTKAIEQLNSKKLDKDWEHFLEKLAKLVGCLPSYFYDGNKHILRKVEEMWTHIGILARENVSLQEENKKLKTNISKFEILAIEHESLKEENARLKLENFKLKGIIP